MQKNYSEKKAKKKFWSDFVSKSWERKPAHFKNAKLSILQLSEQQVFNWLVKYSDHCRKTKTALGIKFYIDGESQYQNEVLQALPLKSDISFLGYHKRISAIFSDYCLVCDELIQVSGDAWHTLGEFTKGLYEKVGFPNRHAEIGLYLGNYKKTPFGVHVDGCSVFSIPIVGEKKFRLWTPAYVQQHPDLEMAFDYAKHLKKSTVMNARPGHLTYWPSSAWHIAESNGAFSATWSIGIWVDQNYHDVVTETLQPLLFKKLKSDSTKKLIPFDAAIRKNGEIKALPPIMKRSAYEISQLTKNELHDLFMKKWLIISSMNGFKSAPGANTKLMLKVADTVCLANTQQIVWAKLSSGILCIASQGQLVELKNSKIATAFLIKLNSGKQIKVSSQINNHFQILQLLYQTGQLQKTNS